MKTRFSKLVRFLPVMILLNWAAFPRAISQEPPQLNIQIVSGLPTLNLRGTDGTVYSIQYSDGLSPTNKWVDRTLVQAKASPIVWNDPMPPTSGCRLYRALSVPAPADPNLVFIQPGTFIMGSPTDEVDRAYWEGPQTVVTISRGFWMGRYEVTQGEYKAVMGNNPSYFQPPHATADTNRPVEEVSWRDATNYCGMLTEREWGTGRIPTSCLYRLPTEAEWEYACRAGTTTRFSYGDDPDYSQLAQYAWFDQNSEGMTHPVGQKRPNAWGLYDMHGTVMEFCWGWFGNYPGGSVVDPLGPPSSGENRTYRGGCWARGGVSCRSASREDFYPGDETRTDEDVGFRVVLAADRP